jgi:hypothetical protein
MSSVFPVAVSKVRMPPSHSVAREPDDRGGPAPADERLAAGLLHHAHHVVDIGGARIRGHHDNHLTPPSARLAAAMPPDIPSA